MHQNARFYETLALLPPEDAYSFLRRARQAELDAYETTAHSQDRARALRQMSLAPRLRQEADLEAEAKVFADYQAFRYVDSVFLNIYGTHRPDVLETLIDPGDFERLVQEPQRQGTPPILLPLHIGPGEMGVALMSTRVPVTAVISRGFPSWEDTVAASSPSHFDFEVHRAPDPWILLRLRRAHRSGRVVTMFPEFSTLEREPACVVPFLGTHVVAREGPALALLARQTRAPFVPYTFRAVGDGRFAYRFYEPIEVGAAGAEAEEMMTEVFRVVEQVLMEGHPGEWEGWLGFDELLAEPVPEVLDHV